jgi:hypothetical protein
MNPQSGGQSGRDAGASARQVGHRRTRADSPVVGVLASSVSAPVSTQVVDLSLDETDRPSRLAGMLLETRREKAA